jgi:FlaA1/EpsC-like NDP-sugar epimerase
MVVANEELERVSEFLSGKRVMVTGACGTVGRELIAQLISRFDLESLTGIDHNESGLAVFEDQHRNTPKLRFLLADVRDTAAMLRVLRDVDVLFHAAGYKHVHVCERSPLEAIQTNVLGVQNVIQAALENGIQRLVFTSSDKAVNPTSVMGTSKLMGERLITAAAVDQHNAGAVFLSVRFGNVMGSRGSVIPIFQDQIRNGGPLTLTHPGMTRFVMSLADAVRLVIESTVLAQAGDVLITKMAAIRIVDLATVVVREFAPLCGRSVDEIEVKIVGPKPGEKLYEELMNEEETRRSFELDRYFVVRPALSSQRTDKESYPTLQKPVSKPYNSANVPPLSQDELIRFLHENGLVKGGSAQIDC